MKENIKHLFNVVKIDNEDTIWVKIKKEMTGGKRDIYVSTTYLKPCSGKESSNGFLKVTENIISLKNKGHIIINGDLNAKSGNLDDTIPPDKFDDGFHICINDNPPKRNSQDKKVNKRGIELVDMCKSFELNIINGRKTGDPFGKYTCFTWNGNSVVDYLSTPDSLFPQISSLEIREFLPWFSDYCPLHFTLEVHKYLEKAHQIPPKEKAPKRFIWTEVGKQKFLNTLSTGEFIRKLESALELDYTNPDTVVNHISDILTSAAENAKIRTIRKREKDTPPPPGSIIHVLP